MNNTTRNKNAELLQDIYSNVKMGSDSIINLLPKIKDDNMKITFEYDDFTPTAQLDASFSVAFAILELNYYTEDRISQLANSIFYEPIKEIMTVQRYANSGLYTPEEIMQDENYGGKHK